MAGWSAMINHIVSHFFQAADLGQPFIMPPELTEEEELAVAILISQEEERRAFPGFEDTLALSMVPPPTTWATTAAVHSPEATRRCKDGVLGR
jgi:hypothetical protein